MDLRDKFVCSHCIGDPFVSKNIEEEGKSVRCNYCNKTRQCIDIDTLSDWVDEVFGRYYQIGEEHPVFIQDQDDPEWERSGEDPDTIIAELLEADELISNDLVRILSEKESWNVAREGAYPYYEDTFEYEEIPIDDSEYSSHWKEFCGLLKHQSRFFNKEAIDLLDNLFVGIEELKYYGDKSPLRIVDGNSEERFFIRVRRANSPEIRKRICLQPWKELGPPSKQIIPANRMNPAGIPVLYGAFELETCLCELRLNSGETAISCQFEIIEPLQVMDLTVFEKIFDRLSMFDPDYERKAGWLKFIRKFDAEISKPVLAHEETLEYIPTQALVEYLANHHQQQIDAIIYSSPQSGGIGKNIAILTHAASVEASGEPNTDDIVLSDFEEYQGEYGYSIFEHSKEKIELDKSVENGLEFSDNKAEPEEPKEEMSSKLRIVPNSLKIHRILGIQVNAESDPVSIFPKDFKENFDI